MSVNVRFAPSPTGKLHVGNIRAALLNWLFAQKQGGSFMLRCDDTDLVRSSRAYEEGIKQDLTWLGLSYDVFARQSERFDAYHAAADWLKQKGFLYPCYETAKELEHKRKLQRVRGLPPVYDRAALALSDMARTQLEAEGRRPHWRLKLSQQPVIWQDEIRGNVTVDTSAVSDPVLIREDGQFLYTLPSCVDDLDFDISHVIRGEDHVTNTATQMELFHHLIVFRGNGQIPCFAHHSLLVDADGSNLSKRLGSLSIEGLRADGLEPQAVNSLLAKLGTSDPVEPVLDIGDLVDGFSFEKMGRAPARFDSADLMALNAKILHASQYASVADRLTSMGISESLWQAVHGNIDTLQDTLFWREIVEGTAQPVIADIDQEYVKIAAELIPDVIQADGWATLTKQLKTQTDRKGKALFLPLRLALTGCPHGPDMSALFQLIGAKKARARLKGICA